MTKFERPLMTEAKKEFKELSHGKVDRHGMVKAFVTQFCEHVGIWQYSDFADDIAIALYATV